MMNFSRRNDTEEQMDQVYVPHDSYERALRDLALINRLTLTHRPTIQWLDGVTRGLPRGARLSVLEVAFGQGDLLRAIHRWGRRRGFRVQLSGIDLNPRSAEAARAITSAEAEIHYQTGDIFEYKPELKPDYVVSSQFTHHLSDDGVVSFIRWMDQNAVMGWHIIDLQRSRIAYFGFKLLSALGRLSPLVRQDGAISIARSFRGVEWRNYLKQASANAVVKWRIPFRYSVCNSKRSR